MEDSIIKIKMAICEFEPGKKEYYSINEIEELDKTGSYGTMELYDVFFRKLLDEHFASYLIKEEEPEDKPCIDMTDAINKFYEENNNPKRSKWRNDFVYGVYNDLGLAVVAYDGIDFLEDVGCIDSKGNYVIPRNYVFNMSYGEGLFATYIFPAGGYINLKNEIVIPFNYESVEPFRNGYAVVIRKDRVPQLIDKANKAVMRIEEVYKIKGTEIYGETLEELKANSAKIIETQQEPTPTIKIH